MIIDLAVFFIYSNGGDSERVIEYVSNPIYGGINTNTFFNNNVNNSYNPPGFINVYDNPYRNRIRSYRAGSNVYRDYDPRPSGNDTNSSSNHTDFNDSWSGCVHDEIIIPPENFKVAFYGDGGGNDNFQQVLELVRDEGADMVLHQGDMVNDEDEELPQRFISRVSSVLDVAGVFPYFFSIGNHDEDDWLGDEDNIGYREILSNRFSSLGVPYVGDPEYLGGKTSFVYGGLLVNLAGPRIDDDLAGDNHWLFLSQQMRNSNVLWKVCSWHKLEKEMQVGGKDDGVGWQLYETCREHGAIIANGHEHSYARTHVLDDMSEQHVIDSVDPLVIMPGQTFTFHAGTAGQNIRDQERCGPEDPPYGCNGEWAVIYTENQSAVHGALFIEFHVDGEPRKARGYFKNIRGEIIDEFELYNDNPMVFECEDDRDVSEGFVYAEGSRFMLSGEEFRFVGVNDYGLANDRSLGYCGDSADHGREPDWYLESMFSYLSSKGINTVRFWYFQSFTDGGTDFSALDRVISYARRYDMKLIPVLENQWDHCPGSIHKYNDWYAEGYLEPYGDYDLSFKDYVERVVTRYENESTIIMWQLMNEAQSEDRDDENDPESLLNFARNMSNFIKSIDNNHLISLGTMSTGQPGTAGEHLINLHNLENIDVVVAHDYDDNAPLPSGRHSIAAALEVANSLNKPFFIGESGVDADSIEERAELFDAKIGALFENGGDGYLVWRWTNTEENFGEGGDTDHQFTEGDPLVDVLESYS